MQTAEFRCAMCGELAATAWLVMPGEADPRAVSQVAIDEARLSIDGPVPVTISPVDAAALGPAIAAGDAGHIYDLDPELVPFWCPWCEVAYCRTHFRQEVEYDDGFFDAIYGTCPKGHRRMLID